MCLLSHHPLVLEEFERVLSHPSFHLMPKQLDSALVPDLRHLSLPRALIYVLDAHAARPATAALITNILDRNPAARLLVVAERFNDANSYSFLRLGVKGLLTYGDARDHLPRALSLVASGGVWVPRGVLSGFIDSILSNAHGRRLRTDTATALSGREREVLESLLENLANKEIANKLNVSEPTIKSHVSDLLNKFGVRRRADLILLSCQRQRANPWERKPRGVKVSARQWSGGEERE